MLTHASLMNILYPMVAAFTQQKGKLCENKRTKFVETCLNKNANSFATSFRQDFVVKGSCEYFRQSSISGVKNDPESTWLANTSTETIELASNAFEKSTILQKMVENWSTNIRSKAPIKVRIRFGFTLSGTFIRAKCWRRQSRWRFWWFCSKEKGRLGSFRPRSEQKRGNSETKIWSKVFEQASAWNE